MHDKSVPDLKSFFKESSVSYKGRAKAVIKGSLQKADKDGFLILYKSMVRLILEYCNPVWSPYLKKHHIMLDYSKKSY